MNRDSLAVLIGAVIAVFAQVVIAPNIAILSAVPNFLAAYVLVVAIVRPTNSSLVLAFALGLIYDLLGYGPVGAMAFLLVLAAFAASRAFSVLNNDTLFMPLVILVVSLLLIEAFYAVFLIALGHTAGLVDAFLYRALPCALYDCVIALVLYPIAVRFLQSGSPLGGSAPSAGPLVKSTAAPTARPVLKSSSKPKRR
ncbi:rod shape-determining protein MreD [Raoultibacter phocaeensis]|uniref:rod shape-determining protein MreD n=1 Tax=Raoultibacter phocaeensis TaxID=2479841 RepID=UPI00111BBE67|nr:rod shape-determining protein MreD [Raoultibacter phocaeensis]